MEALLITKNRNIKRYWFIVIIYLKKMLIIPKLKKFLMNTKKKSCIKKNTHFIPSQTGTILLKMNGRFLRKKKPHALNGFLKLKQKS